MRGFKLRPAVPEDAAAIRSVRADSIRALGPAAYTPEQVTAWANDAKTVRDYAQHIASGQVSTTLAMSGDGQVLGWSDYGFYAKTGTHGLALYVRGDAARRGVGRALFEAAEVLARRAGASELRCTASLVAESFYRAMGVKATGRSVHTFRDGTDLPCVLMAKRLD